MSGQLRVIAVAIKKNGVVYTLPPPARHAHVLALIHLKTNRSFVGSRGQGFILSDGRFAGRFAAARIARMAGQADKHVLFSEDLW